MSALSTSRTWVRARAATIAGLLIGAAGIAILWAAGVPFPTAVPPGLVILVAGALLVGFVRRRWTTAVGAFLGLFVVVGFLVSPTGLSNLTGKAGALVAFGQAVQQVGVLTALIAGVLATRAAYRDPAFASGTQIRAGGGRRA